MQHGAWPAQFSSLRAFCENIRAACSSAQRRASTTPAMRDAVEALRALLVTQPLDRRLFGALDPGPLCR
jgi:hypothetical protein